LRENISKASLHGGGFFFKQLSSSTLLFWESKVHLFIKKEERKKSCNSYSALGTLQKINPHTKAK
jgi:hypothetical protein